MKHPIASCTLWCRHDGSLFACDLSLGAPYEQDGRWLCEWSLGRLHDEAIAGPMSPARSFSSMHALASAQTRMRRVLEMYEGLGMSFYTDADATDRIEDLRSFLPGLGRRRPWRKESWKGTRPVERDEGREGGGDSGGDEDSGWRPRGSGG